MRLTISSFNLLERDGFNICIESMFIFFESSSAAVCPPTLTLKSYTSALNKNLAVYELIP